MQSANIKDNTLHALMNLNNELKGKILELEKELQDTHHKHNCQLEEERKLADDRLKEIECKLQERESKLE